MESVDTKIMLAFLVIGAICLHSSGFTEACTASSSSHQHLAVIDAEELLRARLHFTNAKSIVKGYEIFINSLTVKNCSMHQSTTEIYKCFAYAQNIALGCVS